MRLISIALLIVLRCDVLLGQNVRANDYVAPGTCAGCHREVARQYSQTGMGRSFFQPAPANIIEDYQRRPEFYHARSDTHYEMISKNGEYLQRRWQIGRDGAETNIEELKIDYVIGSGNHSRSYLHRTTRGNLIELPLSWYSEGGGYWAMSPQFDTPHPLTRRFISYECMGCHNAYSPIPAGHDAPGGEPVFAAKLPEGIDCQRCHGPGGNHVRAVRKAGASVEEIRSSIVNPARLDTKLRMEVCLQCHLEPASTGIPAIIRRVTQGPFSYAPGKALSDYLFFFDYPRGKGRDDRFEIVGSSAYRLFQSQCYLQSKGQLTCGTCHQAHRPASGDTALKHYTEACAQCHAAALRALTASGKHPADTECVACHMPKRRTEDVVHAVMTDHLIQRRLPAGDLLGTIPERHVSETVSYRGEVVPYYPATLRSTGDDAIYRAIAQIQMDNNLKTGAAELDAELEKQQPREPELYIELGNAWLRNNQPDRAIRAFDRAARLNPNSLGALLGMSDALKTSGDRVRAAQFLDHALEVAPDDPRPWYRQGVLAFESGQPGTAIERIEKSIALSPDLQVQYTSLADILLRAGQVERARQTLVAALRIDPYDATAYDLDGRALASSGRMPDALYSFEKANRLRPGYAPHLYDYALALFSVNRVDEARKSAEAAIRVNPEMAEPHALLGEIFARQRDYAKAASEFEHTLRINPLFARAHLDLAAALAAQGDMAGAVRHLQDAANGQDPQVARQAAQALDKLRNH